MSTFTQTGMASSGYRMSEVPHFVQYVSPVATGRSSRDLPLGILVQIFSYLDDIGDIARVTRTSRLFKYVALPQLYERVKLRSRAEIKYVESTGRPQGFGGGSPFSAALNGLAIGEHVNYVKHLVISGDHEAGKDEYVQGRVPDATVLLNTVLRMIVDRAVRLETFTWELSAKPTKTLYQGLTRITTLTIRFPNLKIPQPRALIPALPKLRLLKVINIDPLCYPDDLSLLLLQSRSLEDLRLHFSPRMRSQAEPVNCLAEMFHRCLAAGYLPKLKHLGMQNYFGRYSDDFQRICDKNVTKSSTFLDMFGGIRTVGPQVFVDDTWKDLPPTVVNEFTRLRFNEPAPQHVKMLDNATESLVYFYCVNNLSQEEVTGMPSTPQPSPSGEHGALGREYIHVLTRKHGATLKHLLLCDQWVCTSHEIGDIVRYCPNLEQFAVTIDEASAEVFRIVLQFLPNLFALRLHDNDWLQRARMERTLEDRLTEIGTYLQMYPLRALRYVGAGPEVFKVCGTREVFLGDKLETIVNLEVIDDEAVQDIAIWGNDRWDVINEPSLLT